MAHSAITVSDGVSVLVYDEVPTGVGTLDIHVAAALMSSNGNYKDCSVEQNLPSPEYIYRETIAMKEISYGLILLKN